MIISADKTKVFFAVTKCGSTTVEFLLSQIPGTIVLNDIRVKHGNLDDLRYAVKTYPSIADVDMGSIQAYGFIRNPLDRFFSACNYLKRFPYALVNLFPEKFGTENFPIPTNEFDRRWTLADWTSLTLRQRQAIRNLTAEDFLSVPPEKLGFVMREQCHWLKVDQGVQILKYSDFQNETRNLISLFGGDPTVNVPTLNAADDFPTATQYTKTTDVYMAIFSRYQKDYLLFDLYDGSDH